MRNLTADAQINDQAFSGKVLALFNLWVKSGTIKSTER